MKRNKNRRKRYIQWQRSKPTNRFLKWLWALREPEYP